MNGNLKVHAVNELYLKVKKKEKRRKENISKLREGSKRKFEGSNGKKDTLVYYNYLHLLSKILF